MIKNINAKLSKILIIFIFGFAIFKCQNVFAVTKSVGISTFPQTYQIYLNQVKRLHSNWTFTALNTGLDWQTVLQNEGPIKSLERSAIQISFAEVWKWRNSGGNYNVIEEGWVTASELAVGYTMDPRRYLNEMQIFQFETLNYDSTTQNQDGVEKIFYGTLMYKNNIAYIDINGVKKNINKTYSKVVMEAAAKYGISPYHLASRIKQETACDIYNNTSIKGNVPGYIGIYNYYNIGATGGNNPAISGLAYARTQGWTNPELAINGGAKYIAEKYINVGQYTTYLQKFNVNEDSSYALYTHQYMQNILAPSKEAISTYNAYLKMNLLDIPFNFVIPVYTNMPESPADIYSANSSDYVKDSSKVYSTSNLNIRSGPSTNDSVILTIPKETIMTRIGRGIQSGERWDKVRLESGLEGYVFQSYIKEYEYIKVQNIWLNNSNVELSVGESIKLIYTISPNEATYKNVRWESSNSDVVTVDQEGNITGIREGSAVITVTSEDQLKMASAVVNVSVKNPTISLDKDSYTLIVGNSSSFNVIITDSDILDYDIKIKDETIANVEENKIIGIKEGTTNIIVSIKGTDILYQSTINVIELKEGQIILDETLNVDGDIISKIPEGITANELKNKIQTTYLVKFVDINDKQIEETSPIGTGTKIQFVNENNDLIYEYKIIMYGDVNGDGKINSGDLLRIIKHLSNASTFADLILSKAADVTNDEKINSGDLLKIVKYLNKTVELNN